MKYLAIPTTQTEDMYGYGSILLPLDTHTSNELARLKEMFAKVQEMDKKIDGLTYWTSPLDFEITNDEFDELIDVNEDVVVVDLSDEDYEKHTDCDTNDYRVESPYIRVNQFGVTLVYNSKFTSDEVYCSLAFEDFEKNFAESLVV